MRNLNRKERRYRQRSPPNPTNQLLLTQDLQGAGVSRTFERRSRHDERGEKNRGQAKCCGEVHFRRVFAGVVGISSAGGVCAK
jgi:hypothetical protein